MVFTLEEEGGGTIIPVRGIEREKRGGECGFAQQTNAKGDPPLGSVHTGRAFENET
jgi:hypothetical protein